MARRLPEAPADGRPVIPALPLRTVSRAELGLAFLLDAGLRNGQIAEFWDSRGPTELTLSRHYAVSTTEAFLLRCALTIDCGHPGAGRPEDLRLILNGLTGRFLAAFVRLLQAVGGGEAAKRAYCARVFAESVAAGFSTETN